MFQKQKEFITIYHQGFVKKTYLLAMTLTKILKKNGIKFRGMISITK